MRKFANISMQLFDFCAPAEILEGDVHISSEASLCYLDTIEWRDIMSSTAGSVSIDTWDKCKSQVLLFK